MGGNGSMTLGVLTPFLIGPAGGRGYRDGGTGPDVPPRLLSGRPAGKAPFLTELMSGLAYPPRPARPLPPCRDTVHCVNSSFPA